MKHDSNRRFRAEDMAQKARNSPDCDTEVLLLLHLETISDVEELLRILTKGKFLADTLLGAASGFGPVARDKAVSSVITLVDEALASAAHVRDTLMLLRRRATSYVVQLDLEEEES